jgi:hypothetical protein
MKTNGYYIKPEQNHVFLGLFIEGFFRVSYWSNQKVNAFLKLFSIKNTEGSIISNKKVWIEYGKILSIDFSSIL